MTFGEYFKNDVYKVKDLNIDKVDLEWLFVLESPHNDEIENDYPVAGASGKDMAKVLFENNVGDLSLGKLVQDGDSKIGIMNVSRVPLKKTKPFEDKTEFDEMFKKLEGYRRSYMSNQKISKVSRPA